MARTRTTGGPHFDALARLAVRQHGLVTRPQALRAGLTPAMIAQRLSSAVWYRVHPGVYSVAGPVGGDAPERALLGACLAAGPGAVASHRSAAWLWDLLPPPPGPEITVPRDGPHAVGGVIVHRPRDLERGAVLRATARRRRVPVTSPPRTIVDIAAVVGPGTLARAFAAAVTRRYVTLATMQDVLEHARLRGVPGVRNLRRVLAAWGTSPVPASVLERRMEELLLAHGLHGAVREHPVGPGDRYRADFAFVAPRLLIEVDGFRTHGSRDAFQADVTRQNRIVAAGWTPLRYTWWDLKNRPDEVAAEIAGVLEASFVSGTGGPAPTVRG